MSDNPMNLNIVFENEQLAKEVETILLDARKWMDENSNEERWLSDYISNNNLNNGVIFDSFLYPQRIAKSGRTLTTEFIGSPAGDLSSDVVEWFGIKGAVSAEGSLMISQVGEKIDMKFTFDGTSNMPIDLSHELAEENEACPICGDPMVEGLETCDKGECIDMAII